MKINGHEHSVLVVPASPYYDSLYGPFLYHAVQPYITFSVESISGIGRCYHDVRAPKISTEHEGGQPLPKPYTGQSFLLSVPTWALSEKGKQAAAEFARGRK